jgi:3-oxoacyl-[acyl-carrier-protein] synthase-1
VSATVYLRDLGIICALGNGQRQVFRALLAGSREGMKTQPSAQGPFTVGIPPAVNDDLPACFENRLNRLLAVACNQIRPSVERLVKQYGAHRVAVVIGSTDNGSEQSQAALESFKKTGSFPAGYEFSRQEAFHSADFVRHYLGLSGLACAVSTACTSGAKAVITARHFLTIGAADAVVAGGGDIVSPSVLFGFHSLEAVDRDPCLPFSRHRKGINLGEGAALFVIGGRPEKSPFIRLSGCGESSDGHHITAPEPEGREASAAMAAALNEAGLHPEDIDYINLHGTGTDLNDRMESKATARIFPGNPPASSTKALVGHTLGAAGAIELGFCWLLLTQENGQGLLPPHVWDGAYEEGIPRLNLVESGGTTDRLRTCMSNSYAFGGCNVSLVISREDENGGP